MKLLLAISDQNWDGMINAMVEAAEWRKSVTTDEEDEKEEDW